MPSYNLAESVRMFMIIGEQTTEGFNPNQARLYVGLQCEELAEQLAVIAEGEVSSELRFDLRQAILALKTLSSNFKGGKHHGAIMRCDHEKMLDGMIDLAWVAIGATLSTSTSPNLAMAEVARANLDKFPDGKVSRDPVSGKILKPANWREPDLSDYVALKNSDA